MRPSKALKRETRRLVAIAKAIPDKEARNKAFVTLDKRAMINAQHSDSR
jgi:hypothetical protein